MANGSLTTMTSGEGKIRENLVRADVVDCIVALPAQLFYTTGIPVCLWFLDREQGVERRARPARRDAVHRRPPDGPQDQPHTDRADGRGDRADRLDLPPLARHRGAATTPTSRGSARARRSAEIEAAGFTLSPGRYVGAPESEEDEIAFEERMATLVDQLAEEMAENERLARTRSAKALARVGYEV